MTSYMPQGNRRQRRQNRRMGQQAGMGRQRPNRNRNNLSGMGPIGGIDTLGIGNPAARNDIGMSNPSTIGTQPGPPAQPAGPAAPSEDTTNALYPGQDSFLPENYEGSPLYKFQQQEGLKALERLYASRGLTKSGAEIEGNTRFLNQLGAQESARQQGIAQQEADRYERLQRDEANRLERREDADFGRRISVLDRLLAQNPMRYAYPAIGETARLKRGKKAAKAGFVGDNYARQIPGAGASAGPRPTYIPPFGGPPNTDLLGGLGSIGGSAGTTNLIDDVLGGLSKLL